MRRASRLAVALATAGSAGLFLFSCSDQTGPGQARPAYVALTPGFTSSVAGIVPVAAARFVFRHLPDGEIARDTVLALPENTDSIDLVVSVPLLHAGDSLSVVMALIAPGGDTVFRAGPVVVKPVYSGTPPIANLPLTYVGVGANAAEVVILSEPAAAVLSGQTGAFEAEARDSSGSPIPGTPIAWRSLDLTVATVPQKGVGGAVAGAQRGNARIVAELLTGPADTGAMSVTLPPTTIVAESGGGQTGPAAAALSAPLVARVQASDGVGVPDQVVNFAVTLGGGSVAPVSAVTDANGRAQTTWTLGNVVGAQVVSATTPALPSVSASFNATSVATGAGTLDFQAGNAQSALVSTAVAVAPAARVTDLQGNPAPNVTVTFAVTLGGGTLTGAAPVTDANGVATLGSWTLGPNAGLNAITATVTGLTPLQFVALGTGPGGATNMVASAGTGQSALVGTAVSVAPAVTVRDTAGNPIVGVTVNFTVTAGGGSVTGASPVTNASGVAAVGSWTLGAAGSNTLTASLTGLPNVVFSATGTLGAPASVVSVSGNDQSATAGTALAQPLVAEVRDQAGNPLPNVTVNWAAVQGSVTPTVTTTAANGRAQTAWTLGITAITQNASASVSGIAPAVFTATAVFPNPTVLLALVGNSRIPAGGTGTLGITLTAPAPAGGLTVTVSSDNPSVVSVGGQGTVLIPQNGTTGTITLNGVASGTTIIHATAPGYTEGTLSATVSVQVLSMPTTLNVPFGQTASIPLQISTPAPAGGEQVTLVSNDPSVVGVVTAVVTIPAGQQTANGTLSGVFPGTTLLTGTTANFGTAQSTVSTTANLNIVEASASLNESFGTNVTVRLESGGAGIAAPAPGLTVALSAVDPTCLGVPAQATIPTGLVQVTVPLSYGGSATTPCSTRLRATAPNITADSINVTVNPQPAITLNNLTVGLGLQDNTAASFGAAIPIGGRTLHLESSDPGVALVAPNASTAGAASIDVNLTPGASSSGYIVSVPDGATGTATITASMPGYANGTMTVTAAQPAVDIIFLVANTTSLSANDPFQVRIGIPNVNNTTMAAEQAIRVGGTGVTATVTNSDGAVAQLVAGTTGNSVTTVIGVGQARSPTTVAAGGVDFDPLGPGTTTVTATIPNFVTLATASVTVNVTAPSITGSNVTVGADLLESTAGSLGAPAPAGAVLNVTSADPSVAVVSRLAGDAGVASLDINLTTGTSGYSYFVQGIATGTTTLTVSAPGYTSATVTVTVVQPALDIIFLNTTTTSLSANDAFQVRIGVPNGSNTAMQLEQNIRPGGTPLTATITNSDGAVAQLVAGTTGNTVTTGLAEGQARSPASVALGGVELDPLGAGTTTVSATIPGLIALPTASVTVTISAPNMTLVDRTVGSGLQEATSGGLGAPAPLGTAVTVTSSDPSLLLVALNGTTAGAASIDIPLNTGVSSYSFELQALEGVTGSATVTVSAPGYAGTSATVTVVQPAVDIIFLNASTTTLTANDPFQARIGVPAANNQSMQIEQEIRFNGTAVTATITSSSPGVAQLVTNGPIGGTVTVPIAVGQARSPASVALDGVELDPLTAGNTTVAARIPNFFALPTATQLVTVTAPAITMTANTVGSGLQQVMSATLGAAAPAGTVVRITSSNPSVALVAKDAQTAGAAFIDVPLTTGAGSFSYFVQGMDGQTGTVNITATIPGYTDGSTTATIVPPALDIIFLLPTIAATAANDPFQVRLGIPNATNQAIQAEQARRAGGGTLIATVTNSNAAVAQLFTTALPGSQSVTVTITAQNARSGINAASGGVEFDPLAPGSTQVSATITGYVVLPSATVGVTVQ